jgi:hypothetical protein
MLSIAPPFWVFPPAVLGVQDHPTALYLHALFALRARDLGCIEAIYCSHIVNWMALIERRGAELVRDIATGSLSADLVLSAAERAMLSGCPQDRIRSAPGRSSANWPGIPPGACCACGPRCGC